jgi:hypothetical protein
MKRSQSVVEMKKATNVVVSRTQEQVLNKQVRVAWTPIDTPLLATPHAQGQQGRRALRRFRASAARASSDPTASRREQPLLGGDTATRAP